MGSSVTYYVIDFASKLGGLVLLWIFAEDASRMAAAGAAACIWFNLELNIVWHSRVTRDELKGRRR